MPLAPQQARYLAARDALDTASRLVNTEEATWPEGLSEEEERVRSLETSRRHGYWDAFDELGAAEIALVEWAAVELVGRDPDLDWLLAGEGPRGWRRNAATRHKIVELVAQLGRRP